MTKIRMQYFLIFHQLSAFRKGAQYCYIENLPSPLEDRPLKNWISGHMGRRYEQRVTTED